MYSADPKPEAGHIFRSDHFPFAKRGVPAISFGSGKLLADLISGKRPAIASDDLSVARYLGQRQFTSTVTA